MKIGKYTIHTVDTGYFHLDGGAMFGIIPKALWNKRISSDESNKIPLAARSLLLTSSKRKILIDTGMGEKWDDKSRIIYQIDTTEHSLTKSLKELKINKEEITDIFLTHLHFDHAGGCTEYIKDKLIPSFPNANCYIQKNQYEWALNPSDKDRGSFLQKDFQPLIKEGLLRFIDGETQFDDEIKIMVFNGHTFGQQLFKIQDSSNTLFYSGDLLPTAHHIPMPYIMSYDLQPLLTVNEKRNILGKAVEEDWTLFFQHDPVCITGKVTIKDGKFLVKEEKFKA